MNERRQFFEQLNCFFDKIYVITLRRATDRQEHIASQLEGLDYSFFYGKDKREFDIEELKQSGIYDEERAIRNHRFSKPLSAGMIGCSWSHRLVYEDVLENGYKRALILEDDAVVDEEQLELLPEIMEELPGDWELLYFGFGLNETPPKGVFFKKLFYHALSATGFFKYTHKTISNLYPRQISRHIYKAGYHDCTHAYAITQSAAQKLRNLQEPIAFLPDNLLAHAATNGILNAYIILPKLINQQYQISHQPTFSYINH